MAGMHLAESLIENVKNIYDANDYGGNITWADAKLAEALEIALMQIKELQEEVRRLHIAIDNIKAVL